MNNMKQSVRELLGQAQVLYSVGKNEEALTLLKQAQTQDPYCEKTYELMTICYIMMDKYKEARKLLEKYLLVNKKSSMAYFHLGNIAQRELQISHRICTEISQESVLLREATGNRRNFMNAMQVEKG